MKIHSKTEARACARANNLHQTILAHARASALQNSKLSKLMDILLKVTNRSTNLMDRLLEKTNKLLNPPGLLSLDRALHKNHIKCDGKPAAFLSRLKIGYALNR